MKNDIDLIKKGYISKNIAFLLPENTKTVNIHKITANSLHEIEKFKGQSKKFCEEWKALYGKGYAYQVELSNNHIVIVSINGNKSYSRTDFDKHGPLGHQVITNLNQWLNATKDLYGKVSYLPI